MDEAVLKRLVRSGRVTVVDTARRMARVHFDDIGITSGWLYVLQHQDAAVNVAMDDEHKHPGTALAYWLPKVDARVLVLYIPIRDGDGFILGGIS